MIHRIFLKPGLACDSKVDFLWWHLVTFLNESMYYNTVFFIEEIEHPVLNALQGGA
jgi:hypothetical protein